MQIALSPNSELGGEVYGKGCLDLQEVKGDLESSFLRHW